MTSQDEIVRDAHAKKTSQLRDSIKKEASRVSKRRSPRGAQGEKEMKHQQFSDDIARLRAHADELQAVVESREKEIEVLNVTISTIGLALQ